MHPALKKPHNKSPGRVVIADDPEIISQVIDYTSTAEVCASSIMVWFNTFIDNRVFAGEFLTHSLMIGCLRENLVGLFPMKSIPTYEK